jgi:hypothetical protein
LFAKDFFANKPVRHMERPCVAHSQSGSYVQLYPAVAISAIFRPSQSTASFGGEEIPTIRRVSILTLHATEHEVERPTHGRRRGSGAQHRRRTRHNTLLMFAADPGNLDKLDRQFETIEND